MRYVVVINLIIVPFLVVGQKIKYKDLFPIVQSADKENALMMLKEYLKGEPEEPNANLLLAQIYNNRYKEMDVLTQYQMAIANAKEAKLMYERASDLVDEREVKRNNEYYTGPNGTSLLSYDKVKAEIDGSYDKIEMFLEKLPNIYHFFTSSVIYYDRAVKQFAAINERFKTIDDLYLLMNEDIKQELLLLKNNFDSSVFFLDSYVGAIKDYPIKYKQSFKKAPVTTYRLDGMVARVDFLRNNIVVWDYGSWVDQVIEVSETEVHDLRELLAKNDKELEQALTTEDRVADPDDDNEFKSLINKELVFRLGRFDVHSLPASFLFLKDQLIKIKETEKALGPDGPQDIGRRFFHYSRMINMTLTADTLLQAVAVRNTKEERAKFDRYIREVYQNDQGLKDYIEKVESGLNSGLEKNVLQLKKAIIDDLLVTDPDLGKTVKYQGKSLPVFKTDFPDSLEDKKYYTTQKEQLQDGSSYLGGVYKSQGETENIVTYLFKYKDNRVLWYKEFNVEIDSAGPDSNNYPGVLSPTREGCFLVVYSKHLSTQMSMNTIYYLNELGELIQAKILEEEDRFPRMALYEENNNRHVVVFKGKDVLPDKFVEQEATIRALGSGGENIWQGKVSFAGKISGMAVHRAGYLLSGNFTSLETNESGKMDLGKTGKTNIVLFNLSSQGNLQKTIPIITKQSVYTSDIIRTSDRNIMVIGYKGMEEDHNQEGTGQTGNPFHIQTNHQGQVLHSDLDMTD